MLAAGAAYLRVVGPAYGFFGLGLALYFASQGAGRSLWPLLAGTVRLVSAGGGRLADPATASRRADSALRGDGARPRALRLDSGGRDPPGRLGRSLGRRLSRSHAVRYNGLSRSPTGEAPVKLDVGMLTHDLKSMPRVRAKGRGARLRLPLVLRDAARSVSSARRRCRSHFVDPSRHRHRGGLPAQPHDPRPDRMGPAESLAGSLHPRAAGEGRTSSGASRSSSSRPGRRCARSCWRSGTSGIAGRTGPSSRSRGSSTAST